MTVVAILGATGHIGRALAGHYAQRPDVELELYSRRPEVLERVFSEHARAVHIHHRSIYDLRNCQPDILINAIGIGDPAKAREAGPAFYDLTMEAEARIDRVIRDRPSCLTVFMSSGAVYGGFSEGPAGEDMPAATPINALTSGDWYGAAKIAAELRHRAKANMRVLDIRVFGFVSPFLDLSADYLVCDIVRAIMTGKAMQTDSANVVRDYIGTSELVAIIDAGERTPVINLAVDTYSRAPVSKFALLESLRHLGLDWRVESLPHVSPRHHYWSRHRGAERIGYIPERNSVDIVGAVVSELTELGLR